MTNMTYAPRYVALGAMLLAGVWGCSTMQEPMALGQARSSFMQAQQNPQITGQAPVAMRQAEGTLHQAEQVWESDRDGAETQHLAYLTERRVGVARATAQQKEAEADIQRLSGERDRVVLEARTRETQQAHQEAQEATTRATHLAQQLAELQARQTDRGLVLTLSDVLFEFNRADLKPGAMRDLYPLVTFLRENPTRTVAIEGHTDSIGSQSYNIELSEHRADAVRAFLLAQSIDSGRIAAVGYGKTYPVASNDSNAGRQQNRRVEVIVQ
jgi:outer membrane protein OmpA-like peptidoglycan-associated protein